MSSVTIGRHPAPPPRRPADTGPLVPGAPTVRVFGYGIFGGVTLRRAG